MIELILSETVLPRTLTQSHRVGVSSVACPNSRTLRCGQPHPKVGYGQLTMKKNALVRYER